MNGSQLDIEGVLQSVTIRARVALLLVIAERALELVGRNPNWHQAGRTAVQDGWRWVQGESVRPGVFDKHFHDDNDEGIDIFSQQSSGVEEAAWIVLGYVVLYVAWHAQRAGSGEQAMSQTVAEVTEEACHETLAAAARLPGSGRGRLVALANWLLAKYGATDNQVGPPIRRDEVMTVLNGASA